MKNDYEKRFLNIEYTNSNSLEDDTDFDIRVEMAKELQEMGLQVKSIERILSIRLPSDQSQDLSRGVE